MHESYKYPIREAQVHLLAQFSKYFLFIVNLKESVWFSFCNGEFKIISF